MHVSLHKVQDCKICPWVCGPVSHGQSTVVCVTDQGDTGGHVIGTDQSVVGRR